MNVRVPVRPRLKPITVHRGDAELVLAVRALRRVHLADPTGGLAELLALLADGTLDVPRLAAAMAERGHPLSVDELGSLLSTLDTMGVLDRADADDEIQAPVRTRHQSNLQFYDLFGTLDRTSPAMHAAVAGSRVLLLGQPGGGVARQRGPA